MNFSKLLQIKSSKIKTELDIDKCLKDKAKERRIRKNKIRIRLRDEGKAWQDWPVG